MNTKPITAAIHSRRAPLWIGLLTIIALSWIELARLVSGMSAMPDMMPMDGRSMMMAGGIAADWLPAFGMWSVMMAAMMLPTELPAVSVYMMLATRRHPARSAAPPAAFFVAGYLAAWLGFAAAAAAAQSGLAGIALPAAKIDSALGSAILLTAGAFQFSRIKNTCLIRCRMPLAFFLAKWRDGNIGALTLGLRRGAYCVGCCWALMALMFIAGAMNLLWMSVLMIFILGEKVAPPAWRLGHIAGAAFLACGIITAITLVL